MPTTGTCLNCGAALDGRYCRACGQDGSLALRPWRELLTEWSDAVLGWETRTGRTLRALLFEPGRLTIEYAAGRRAAWIHPLRVYLGANVIALAVFGATTDTIVAHDAIALHSDGQLVQFGQLILLVSAVMFLLVPAHAATYALVFRNTRRYYAEHLVMVLNASSFLLTAEAFASLLQFLWVQLDAPSWTLYATRWAAHLVVLGYGWLTVRRVYRLGAIETLVRLTLAVSLFVPVLVAVSWAMLELRR